MSIMTLYYEEIGKLGNKNRDKKQVFVINPSLLTFCFMNDTWSSKEFIFTTRVLVIYSVLRVTKKELSEKKYYVLLKKS